MFDLSGENANKFEGIYERCKDNANPDTDDVLDLIAMFTFEIPPLQGNAHYADFIVDVVRNIYTGRWTMLPYMWASHALLDGAAFMNVSDEKRACDKISKESIHMSRELQLSTTSPSDARRLALHWVRGDSYGFGHTGFQNMLCAAKAFYDISNFLRKKETENE